MKARLVMELTKRGLAKRKERQKKRMREKTDLEEMGAEVWKMRRTAEGTGSIHCIYKHVSIVTNW